MVKFKDLACFWYEFVVFMANKNAKSKQISCFILERDFNGTVTVRTV